MTTATNSLCLVSLFKKAAEEVTVYQDRQWKDNLVMSRFRANIIAVRMQ